MKGLFSKLINKINDLPNSAGLTTTIQNINQNHNNTPVPKPPESQNNVDKNNQLNTQSKNHNNINIVNNVNNVNNNQNNKTKIDQIVIVNERQEEKK